MTKPKRTPKATNHSTWSKIARALIANPAILLVCLCSFITLLGLLFIWTSSNIVAMLCILALVIAFLIFSPKPPHQFPFGAKVITEDEICLDLSEGRIQASRKENAETPKPRDYRQSKPKKHAD